jgi:hypothetical protein
MGKPRRQFFIFSHAPRSGIAAWLSLLGPSPLQYAIHMERLAGIQVYSLHYIPMTDDFDVKAQYVGHEVSIGMEWGGDLYLVADAEMPEQSFKELCAHMKQYRRVGIIESNRAKKRHAAIVQAEG